MGEIMVRNENIAKSMAFCLIKGYVSKYSHNP